MLYMLAKRFREGKKIGLGGGNFWFFDVAIDRDQVTAETCQLIIALRISVAVAFDGSDDSNQRNAQ